MPELRALVVTGGTEVDIDDVRVITNRSKGRFGCTVANLFAARGVNVTLLAAERTLSMYGDTVGGVSGIYTFRTYQELYDQVKDLANTGDFDFILMPAAISDYAPVPVEGKIRSKNDEQTLVLKRTPKILANLREWVPNRPFIVGWKLLSDVTDDELISVALAQVKSCRINLTIANDWSKLSLPENKGLHPCYAVTPEGGAIPLEGSKTDVSAAIVDLCINRQAVQWSRTELYDEDVLYPGVDPKDTFVDSLEEAQALLAFAQEANLLDSSDGNVTQLISSIPTHFWATPRGVQKGDVKPDEFIFASADISDRLTRAHGTVKPSIDCSVHARLYHDMKGLKALLHFHGGYVVPHTKTVYPYPCGTVQEAQEILHCLGPYRLSQSWTLDLVNHGTLIGFGDGDVAFMRSEWEDVKLEWAQHIRDVGQEEILAESKLTPVIAWGRIAGLVAQYEDWNSAYLLPGYRGMGVGKHVAETFVARRLTVAAHDLCKVKDYYISHGYEVVRHTDDGINILRLP